MRFGKAIPFLYKPSRLQNSIISFHGKSIINFVICSSLNVSFQTTRTNSDLHLHLMFDTIKGCIYFIRVTLVSVNPKPFPSISFSYLPFFVISESAFVSLTILEQNRIGFKPDFLLILISLLCYFCVEYSITIPV